MWTGNSMRLAVDGERWGGMTRSTEKTKKEADEYCVVAYTARWKLSDDVIALRND